MGKIRVYSLAKDLNITSKQLLSILNDLDVEVKNHMSTLEEETAKLVYEVINDEKKPKEDKSKVGVSKNSEKFDEKIIKKEKSENNLSNDKTITIDEQISIKELSKKISVDSSKIIKILFEKGIVATINQNINFEDAVFIAENFGCKLKKINNDLEKKDRCKNKATNENELENRPPIVTIMGHVDHGKTTLLDAIRKENIASSEAGGITQHIGAYTVNVNGKKVIFLDTPGHEAFTEMRARGAKVTDIAILVVAADDGIMPQTIEAINHAKAADIPIIVAVNKTDKPNSDPEKVKQQLTEHGLVPEEWGGETICVPVSAINKEGLDLLLEMILLVGEVSELKAVCETPAEGTIIESKLDKGRGPVATVLIQNGTLCIGDSIVAGTASGRVRAMIDDRGIRIKHAIPSTPVEVLGLTDVPKAGDIFYSVKEDKDAKSIVEMRKLEKKKELLKKTSKLNLDELFDKIQKGEVKELNVIIKSDVQGSSEAIKQALEKLSSNEVRVKIVHEGVGGITETDVMLASASNAIILGFNVRPDTNAKKVSEKEKVDIRTYRVIYDMIEDIESAMKGMLDPTYKEELIGKAEVRAIFKVPNVGVVAGCYVLEGEILRNSSIRVVRNGIIVHEGNISSLKRFKDDVKKVSVGYECGIGLEKYNDIKENDIFESIIIKEV